MKPLIAFTFFLASAVVLAAPSDFRINGETATFVDFKRIEHEITVNPGGHFTTVKSTIDLSQKNRGNILFDFRAGADTVYLNGARMKSKKIETPRGEISLNMLDQESSPGDHTLVINSALGFSFGGRRDIYFKMRDLYGWFLDRKLPTNLEYDQHEVIIKLKINLKDASKYRPMTNALSTEWDEARRTWVLTFPKYFTSSSLFFHLIHKDEYSFLESVYKTTTGRNIPIRIYGPHKIPLSDYEVRAQEVMAEMEADYGEYAHPELVIYARGGRGGMEFAGATETSLGSLGHEIFHTYFGRGIMPSDGNSGFIDEGLASWRDYGYQRVERPNFSSSKVAGRSEYEKGTHKHSYKKGRSFFAYVDHKLAAKGGLKLFLRDYYKKNVYQTVTIQGFLKELNDWSGMDFTKDFDQYLR